MDDTLYHQRADATLAHIAEALEPAYDSGSLDDLEQADAVLTITTASGRVLVVSKHSPTQQIWLASRSSGGLHFAYHESGDWRLADGRTLLATLSADLAADNIVVKL